MTSARDEFLAGIRAQLPLLLGVAPFGLAYGAYAVEAGVTPPLAQSMSAIVFGGASQFVAVRLIQDGVPGVVIVLTVALVNLRHMLYSASLAPYVARLPLRWRYALAYLMTDEAYATTIRHYRETGATQTNNQPVRDPADSRSINRQMREEGAPKTTTIKRELSAAPNAHWFFLGTGVALWTSWQFTTAVGVFVGASVPESWALDFALPLTFIALLVPALPGRPAGAAAALAAVVAVFGFRWDYGTGLVLAIVAGMAAGLTVARLDPRTTAGEGER